MDGHERSVRMTTDRSEEATPKAHRLTIRTRRTIAGDGEETNISTTFCPLHERSIAMTECEGCSHFHGLHFEPGTRATSIVCGAASSSPLGAPRGEIGGPPDPTTPLAAIMTRDVVCVRGDVDLDQAREILVDRGFGGLPVVDEDGKPIGILSRADVLRAARDRGDTEEVVQVTAKPKDHDDLGLGKGFHAYEPAKQTVGDAMSPLVLALHEGSNIGQASSLMAYEGIHRIPVIADDGRVVGILSSLDVLRWFGRQSGYLIPPGHTHRHV
jgi:CBS domain-containing protein